MTFLYRKQQCERMRIALLDLPLVLREMNMTVKQSAEIEAVLGPPLRESVIQLIGVPLLHRATWICGCSTDFADDDGDRTSSFNPSMRWHRCAYHRRLEPVYAAT